MPVMSLARTRLPSFGFTCTQCSPASTEWNKEPAAPPTQTSDPNAATTRNTAFDDTGILAQVLPPSRDRCKLPSALSVQRGAITEARETSAAAALRSIKPTLLADAPLISATVACFALPAATSSFFATSFTGRSSLSVCAGLAGTFAVFVKDSARAPAGFSDRRTAGTGGVEASSFCTLRSG